MKYIYTHHIEYEWIFDEFVHNGMPRHKKCVQCFNISCKNFSTQMIDISSIFFWLEIITCQINQNNTKCLADFPITLTPNKTWQNEEDIKSPF